MTDLIKAASLHRNAGLRTQCISKQRVESRWDELGTRNWRSRTANTGNYWTGLGVDVDESVSSVSAGVGIAEGDSGAAMATEGFDQALARANSTVRCG